MSREVHVQFWERVGVKFPCATHLPLYRQEMILASRHGLVITRQTMVEWLSLAAYWLKPLYDMLSWQVFSSGYVQIDETPVRYLAPGNGKTKLGYFWVAREPKSDCVFHWEKSRSTASLEKLVPADFSGTIQCDGYEAYRRFAKTRAPGTIELVACMAHIRRDFVNAIPAFPRTAAFILCHIRNLYKIEEELREKKAGPELRKAVRNSSSRPIINRLEKAFELLSRSSQILPQSLMGKALAYARNQWPAMRNYLEDGRLEMDINLVENSIRPTALGKKNWLFIGHAEAGQTSAIIFTLIVACRKRGIDPFRYLRDIFTRLPTMTNWQIKEILPDAWLAARNRDQRVAA